MSVQGSYLKAEPEFSDRNGNSVENGCNKIISYNKEDKVYTYDEALDLVGNGWYTFGLLVYIILAFQAVCLDLFSFSVVMIGACDMNLTHYQKSVLLSMPLIEVLSIGSVVMAWPWGYFADTQGRRRSMALSLWGSFILATMNAFSPNWIVMAVLKFASAAFSSGTQSLGYTLLGESCSQKFKATFLMIVSTSSVVTFGVYTVLGYFFLNLDFSVDLNFIKFSNWRLLMLLFASTLGISALFTHFIHESPKFLLNAGHEKRAIEVLKKITRRNGGDDSKFPVKRIVLNEITTTKLQSVPLWQSLRDQTLPLFKPPLLWRTIQLFYITVTVFAPNNGVYPWLPFIFDTFYSGYNAGNSTNGGNSVCDMIVNSDKLNTDTEVSNDYETCAGTVKDLVLWMSLIQSGCFMVLNLGLSLLSRWKKSVVIGLFVLASICGVAIPLVTDRLAGMILINGFMINVLSVSLIFSYYIDLFPTSYRGMANCLGIMVARISAVVGCNLVGSYIASHCKTSFYAWSVYVLSGAVVSLFLPPDNVKKTA